MDLSLHLVSDLDGTWIPTKGETPSLRSLENYLTNLHGLTLTFATGRTLHSAVTDLSSIVRLWPTYFVTDVGTAIYRRTAKGKWIEDTEYARRLNSIWDQDAAERISQSLPEGIRQQPGLRVRRRLALEVLPGFDLQQAAEELSNQLVKAGFAGDVLPSNGCCLDVLPKGVDKGTAVDYLDIRLPPPSFLMVCGDSENDLGMFRKADMAVVMADSPLKMEAIDVPISRLIRPRAPGPAGILEVLYNMRSQGISGGLQRAPILHSGTENTGGVS